MADRVPPIRARLLNGAPQTAVAVLVAILAVACLAGVWRAAAVAGLRVPLDPNEGWNAYHAAATMAGHGPYPAAGSFMTNNYPPISFYVVGIFGKFLGDNIIAGRLVSLGAFALVTGAIWLLARRFGCDRLQAGFSAAFFISFLLLYSDYVGIDDPQMLGHALQMAALLLLLLARPSFAIEVAAAALFVAGIFVKQNLLAMPLAAVSWLLLCDRKAGARIAASMLIFVLGGLIACRITLGINLLTQLNSPRIYSLPLLAVNLHNWLIPAALPLSATLIVGIWQRGAAFCVLYALAGTLFGGVLLGGAGVDANAMFDADFAIAIGIAIAVSRLASGSGRHLRLAALALILAAVLPFAAELVRNYDSEWLKPDFWLRPLQQDAAVSKSDIAYLRVHDGAAMCESLSLCYWAGKPQAVDVFNLDQQFRTGSRNTTPFVQLLNAGGFAVIQFDSLKPFPLPPEVENAVVRNYRIDRVNDDGVFLIPRRVRPTVLP